MNGATNTPKGVNIPGGVTSTPVQKSTIPLIMELSDDEDEEGVEVIEDSDNDDGMPFFCQICGISVNRSKIIYRETREL